MKPFLTFEWMPVDWEIRGHKAVAPFKTVLHGIHECSTCLKDMEEGTKGYLDNDLERIKAEAKAAKSDERFYIDGLKLLCEDCFILKAKRQWLTRARAMKAAGLKNDAIARIRIACHRCIIGGSDGD